ncbi:hypothetical protein [Thalassospira alkalitolerans]|uniref:hypothetical protein n=1 Tax=Thalassospira alkalitolerans TaxID=1293890 RepID=UPI0030EDF0C8|tara:strand:- start:47222 stop:48550 length:1329 start_codon:yes stop_codon:yes gene_type:complete
MRLFKFIVKSILRLNVCAIILAGFFVLSREEFRKKLFSRNKKMVLVFSPNRWKEDISVIKDDGRLEFCEFSEDIVYLVNSLYYGDVYCSEGNNYFRCDEDSFLQGRSRHVNYLATFLWALKLFMPFGAIVTCSFRYVQEVPWALASEKKRIPFVAWHKEFTVLDHRYLRRRALEAKRMRLKFYGSHLLCVNNFGKDLLIRASIAKPEQIEVVGLVRADILHEKRRREQLSMKKKDALILFSFGHLTGPFPSHPFRHYYFSATNDFGFVSLFRKVHALFAQVSEEFPDIEFLIKPKNIEPGWISEIENEILAETGKKLDSYPNCRITDAGAHDLIGRSLGNVVLNSTTVIESRMANCNTIMPLFEEAANVHSDMLYFQDDIDIFSVADSEEEFCNLLRKSAEGQVFSQGTEERLLEFLLKQIGNADGASANRLVDGLLVAIDG